MTCPNVWAFFGGGIEKDESPDQAVVREAKEELQIELHNPQFFKRYVHSTTRGLIEKFVFISPLQWSIKALRMQQQEGDDLGIFSSSVIHTLKLLPYDLEPIKDIFNHLQHKI